MILVQEKQSEDRTVMGAHYVTVFNTRLLKNNQSVKKNQSPNLVYLYL